MFAVANNARRDGNDDFLFVLFVGLGTKQAAQDGDIAEARNAGGAGAVLVLDQAANDFGLPVLEAQHRVHAARADGVGNGAVFGRVRVLAAVGADLQRQPDGNLAVGINGGLDLDLDAHVHILDVGVVDRRSGGRSRHRRGGDHRQAVADQKFGLFLVAYADAGCGQVVDVRVGFLGVDGAAQGRDIDVRRAQRAELLQRHAAGAGAKAGGQVNTQGHQPGMRHLHHIHLQHHLGFGLVHGGNQLLDQADDLRRVAYHQGIGLFVNEHILGLDHGFDHGHHVLGVGIGHGKAANLELGVIARLGLGVRVNQKRVLAHHPFGGLGLHQDQVDRLFNRRIAHKDADLQVALDVLVKQDVQAGGAGNCLHHHTQIGIAELQRHGLAALEV